MRVWAWRGEAGWSSKRWPATVISSTCSLGGSVCGTYWAEGRSECASSTRPEGEETYVARKARRSGDGDGIGPDEHAEQDVPEHEVDDCTTRSRQLLRPSSCRLKSRL